jgi:hypothetical protein
VSSSYQDTNHDYQLAAGVTFGQTLPETGFWRHFFQDDKLSFLLKFINV